MANFHYKGRDTGGDLVTGDIDASSVDEAASSLIDRAITPIEIGKSRSSPRIPKRPMTVAPRRKSQLRLRKPSIRLWLAVVLRLVN